MVICLPYNNSIVCACVCVSQTVKAFLPQMKANNHGHIVTIASVLGLFSTACVEVTQWGRSITAPPKIWQLCCASCLVFVPFHTILCLSQQMKSEIQTKTQHTEQVWWLQLFCKSGNVRLSFDRITVRASLLRWASMSLWLTNCWQRRLTGWRRLWCAPTSWTRECLKAARYGMSTQCWRTIGDQWMF